jgi:hypothetical protein
LRFAIEMAEKQERSAGRDEEIARVWKGIKLEERPLVGRCLLTRTQQ